MAPERGLTPAGAGRATFTYDGTFEGLLTTLRAIWLHRAEPEAIRPAAGAQEGLFADSIHVDTDLATAATVWQNLQRWVSDEVRTKLYYVFLTEEPDAELLIFRYVQTAIREGGRDLSEDYLDDTVRRVHALARRMWREKHRMEAFVRFEQAADGLFYVTLRPDVNVLPLLADHFGARYADQRWLIFDERRHFGLYYDGREVAVVQPDHEAVAVATSPATVAAPANRVADREPLYQRLWQTYYKHVNIPARRNPKLHKRHLPLRYWQYLTEKRPVNN